MQIGKKINRMRLKLGLTQEELAARTELSKGFISQLERDLTSPSIITLTDILECLGTTPGDFFSEREREQLVFHEEDMFEKEEDGRNILWLIPNAQKNALEPIMLTLEPKSTSVLDAPHEGEEFGYVLQGSGVLHYGEERHRIKKGSSFYYNPSLPHSIENTGNGRLKIIWVSTPPSF